MAAVSNYALRIPPSLMDDLRNAADADGVSMNCFIVQAVAEKVAALKAKRTPSPGEQYAYMEQRASRPRSLEMYDILSKAGTTTAVLPGDELPEGWLDAGAGETAATGC